MEKDINFHLSNIEYEIRFSDIEDFDRFEERFCEIERYFGDIAGMGSELGVDFVEFCPNNNPPTLREELLPWIWLIHPSLHKEISLIANKELNELMHDYNYFKKEPLKVNNMNSIEKLVEEFTQGAINQHKYTQEGNWKKGNAEVENINEIYELIKKQNGMEELLKLIYSNISEVASLAATYCMRYNPEKCLAVMEKLSKEDIPFISMGAKYTIQNWNSNKWHID